MKKKKGFTLIELLAVIVILAIIALIAVPVIMNILNKANKSALKDTAYGVISAGELYFAEEQLDLNGMSEEKVFTFPTTEIEVKGNVPEGTVLKVNPDGEVALIMTNGRYCITKGYEENDITVSEDLTACGGSNGGADNGGSGNTDSKTLSALAVADLGLTVPACVTSGTCAAGTSIAIKVNATETYKFYVLSDVNNKVTLLMATNLYADGDTTSAGVAWLSSADYVAAGGGCATDGSCYATPAESVYGPLTALRILKDRTSDWDNISEYSYELNYGKVYRYEGNNPVEVEGKYKGEYTENVKARLPKLTDFIDTGICTSNGTCTDWVIESLTTTGDDNVAAYWLSDAGDGYQIAYTVSPIYEPGSHITASTGGGGYVTDESTNSLRPVITISR